MFLSPFFVNIYVLSGDGMCPNSLIIYVLNGMPLSPFFVNIYILSEYTGSTNGFGATRGF